MDGGRHTIGLVPTPAAQVATPRVSAGPPRRRCVTAPPHCGSAAQTSAQRHAPIRRQVTRLGRSFCLS
jgi:hypothetical protein